MSADNGIYIAEFSDGFRVCHGQAIDNLSYYPSGSKEEKDEWKRYFGNSKVFVTKDKAGLEASKLYDQYGWTEYGIVHLGRGVDFLESSPITSHEFARNLLSFPNLPITGLDGNGIPQFEQISLLDETDPNKPAKDVIEISIQK